MPATRNRANSRALLAAAGLATRGLGCLGPAAGAQRALFAARSAPEQVAARQNRLSPGPAAMTTDSLQSNTVRCPPRRGLVPVAFSAPPRPVCPETVSAAPGRREAA